MTKTYAITKKLRGEFIDIMRNNPQDPEAYDAITELESLPLITGEPVAWITQSGTLVNDVLLNLTGALEYGWTPLYTHPQPITDTKP